MELSSPAIHGIEPPRKRQRLSSSSSRETGQSGRAFSSRASTEQQFPSPFESFDTSFRSSPTSLRKDTLDISKYIPIGCLRLSRHDLAPEIWESHSSWSAFAYSYERQTPYGTRFLSKTMQETLARSGCLAHCQGLHNAGWIRLEFKSRDRDSGQIRVYVLPDDIGRSFINRDSTSLRHAMKSLLAQLDISRNTWVGNWQDSVPILHANPNMNDTTIDDGTTLFEIFNTLPSPAPDPDLVRDYSARDSMHSILTNSIQGVKTKLFDFQMRSAALMLQRETQPSQIVDPRLTSVLDQRGSKWYYDMESGICLLEPRLYEAPRGGICAETMGYGKTLICLALILATRDEYSQIPAEFSVGTIPRRQKTGSLKQMCAATIGRTGIPWKKYFAALEAEGYDYSPCTDVIKDSPGFYFLPGPPPRRASRNPVMSPPRKILLTTATIVIVPANLVEQWVSQIKDHTIGLKYLVMDSSKKKLPSAPELADYDIILFSKQRFDKESKDGSDQQGRRESTSTRLCRCPYIGATRIRDCFCFRTGDIYNSPLRDLHFKRIITDEGHTFGNSSNKTATEGITVVDYLQVSARWIISGTPTPGLHSKEVTMTATQRRGSINSISTHSDSEQSLDSSASTPIISSTIEPSAQKISLDETMFFKQERKDLEKLGHIAKMYLKARPWASTRDDSDTASWAQYVMQPRHGSNSRGNMDCLRSTLESMIIRHRVEDVERDIVLPPLHQKIVTLEGSLLDNMSLNTFSMMITSNAVTSERKDADYLFHPKQRKALQELVSNLRQASFFWSGYDGSDVQVTIDIAKKFLEKKEVPVSQEDEILLLQAILAGEMVLSNKISSVISNWHEMPMFVRTGCDADIRKSWSLSGDDRDPTLIGATMLHSMQKFVTGQLWKEDPTEGLAVHGESTMNAVQDPMVYKKPKTKNNGADSKSPKVSRTLPTLAGGVKVGDTPTSLKRPRTSTIHALKAAVNDQSEKTTESPEISETGTSPTAGKCTTKLSPSKKSPAGKTSKSALKNPEAVGVAGTIDQTSPLASASILSTASAKLSYLMDNIVKYHTDEKILVFYEADNVAYYIAQALECLGIKHLIYAKSLTSARRSQYVVTFNHSQVFRVLLMDVSQAAYGLDLSSASRVFFVNPVFSPQVEAQAVKRAHRIGQTKPVFVETLVLKGSIEEVILERRGGMTDEEHIKCKNILEDKTMYDWIRNVRFIPTPIDDSPEPEQMAKLNKPQMLFGRGGTAVTDPDADLIRNDDAVDDETIPQSSAKGKGKGIVKIRFRQTLTESTSSTSDESTGSSQKKKRKRVGFASSSAEGNDE